MSLVVLALAAKEANEQQGHDELLHLQPVQQALRLRSPQPQPALQGEAVGLPPGASDRQGEPEALDATPRPAPASPGAARGEAALAAFRQSQTRAERLRRFVTKSPDLDKLERAVLDALTAVVWVDDSQVAEVDKRKVYADDMPPGVNVTVAVLEGLKEVAL